MGSCSYRIKDEPGGKAVSTQACKRKAAFCISCSEPALTPWDTIKCQSLPKNPSARGTAWYEVTGTEQMRPKSLPRAH